MGHLTGTPHRISGSVASAALGVVRSTLDIDIVAEVREVPLSMAEDSVLRKLELYEWTVRTSERQWRDGVGVLQVQGPALDWDYLRRLAGELRLPELLGESARATGLA
ncbi:MAG: hypothetical protein R3F49_17385 [Planctomycetota bacterium]